MSTMVQTFGAKCDDLLAKVGDKSPIRRHVGNDGSREYQSHAPLDDNTESDLHPVFLNNHIFVLGDEGYELPIGAGSKRLIGGTCDKYCFRIADDDTIEARPGARDGAAGLARRAVLSAG